ncbi:class II aldolase/adducin family protein [Cupriavidus taiwanensis]|uniref:class II aldolase/adducin family protein n=1 Tax=Cupriavidus taiwanensis TaxID=164546 RepID=UPI000E2030CC|nr:class II aldolase/adducin family protein [Cupriavidus taiwanensis]
MKIPISQVRQVVSCEEWEMRVELAACYRLMSLYGITDMIYNHISARIPGTDHLLINAYGYLYSEITASNLITIDMSGEVVLQPENELGYVVNPAGAIIHTSVHKAREDVGCVIHTHTRAGMAVSSLEAGLLPLTQTAMRFEGYVGYHDYEGPVLNRDEEERLQRDLGSNEVLVLRNHGMLVVGPTVPEAFNRCYWLEIACKVQVDAMHMSGNLRLPARELCQMTAKVFHPEGRLVGHSAWPAMLRLLASSGASDFAT